MVKVITAITSFTLNLWRSRCSQVLGGMGNHRIWKKREHLLAQVNDLVKDQSVLMMNGKYHINGALGDSAIVCNLLVWIGTTRALYYQCYVWGKLSDGTLADSHHLICCSRIKMLLNYIKVLISIYSKFKTCTFMFQLPNIVKLKTGHVKGYK